MTFAFYPKGFLGRPLHFVEASEGGPLRGNDVIALQLACGLTGQDADGVFGQRTDQALRILQSLLGVAADGIAGPATERAYCLRQIGRNDEGIPPGLPRGILEGEAGYRLGAQSPMYERNGIWRADLGVTQISTVETDAGAVILALNAAHAIASLCDRLRHKRAAYYDATYVSEHPERARIAGWLACASWNAPAWADVWAKEGPKNPYLQIAVTLQNGTKGTREQWMRNYVSTKIAYVTTWQV